MNMSDDLDDFIAEMMQDPEFVAAYNRAKRRSARRRRLSISYWVRRTTAWLNRRARNNTGEASL